MILAYIYIYPVWGDYSKGLGDRCLQETSIGNENYIIVLICPH